VDDDRSRYGAIVRPDRPGPLRINVLTHPKSPHRGAAFIPGVGLVLFEGASVSSRGPLAQPVAELEAEIRYGLVSRIAKGVGWFGLATGGVFLGTFGAVLAFLGVFVLLIYGIIGLVEGHAALGLLNLFGAAVVAALTRYIYRAIDKFNPHFGKPVRVGDDGLLIGDRYLGFEDIDAVQSNRVRLHDGTLLSFRPGQSEEPDARGKHQAYLNQRASALPEGASRKDESLSAWSNRLGAMLRSGSGSFRGATLSTDDLWAVAENPRASAIERAGAATALAHSGEPERLRIAELGQRIASPSLQRIFERSAKGDHAAIEEELAALEQEQLSASRDRGRN